jgi:hypothetical protein
MLRKQGRRTAVITNDQGDDLVDTHRVRAAGIDAAEIGQGCFCCKFSAFIDALDRVMEYGPEVIFAEPVGSCTDLAATVVRPLESAYSARFRVAPLTVLVDPERATDADPNVRFLFDNQVREADVLCYSKADQHRGPGDGLHVSAVTGEGVGEWLEVLSAWHTEVGVRTLSIDYDRYAAAEAALGWLNARVDLCLREPLSPASVIGPLLEDIDGRLTALRAGIVHLKVFDQTPSAYLKASIVANGQEPDIEGDLLAEPERSHEVIINLRALGDPPALREAVEASLATIDGDASNRELAAFAPGYPKPERRLPA